MNVRRFLAEAATIAGLAIVCALVSNALARKERRLDLPGDYPNATTVTTSGPRHPMAPFDAGSPPTPAPGPALPGPAAGQAGSPAKPPAPASPAPAGAPAAPAATAPAAAPAADELLKRFPPHGQPYVEISGEAAAWLHARGALFLDARRSRDYAEGHVAGARSFPVWEPEVVKERVEAFLAEPYDRSAPVVAYCTGGDCEDSHMLAQTLFGAGFENLLVYRDGFPDWRTRGGAVSSGEAR